jgi:hypothetical protein
MANVDYQVPSSGNSNVAEGSDTLETTLELGDTLTLSFGTQDSGWTFSQADSFFNATDISGSYSTAGIDASNTGSYSYVIDCDGSYPSGSSTVLNINKSANTGGDPYLALTVNTRSLDSTITKDLIHNGSSINGFPIYYSPNGNVTFSYTNGGAYTRYRVITTSASSSPSGTVINGRGCGNAVGTSGTIDIEYKATGNELCNIEGSQVSYKVQYRPRNLATTYQDTGTTFTLTHIVSSPGSISVSNAGASSPTETVTVSCAINPPTDCILEFSTSSSFSSNVVAADANREADFSQTRNTTVTYYARFRNTTTNAVTFGTYPSVSHTVNYLALNDNEISMAVQSASLGPYFSESYVFSYTNGGASAEYRLVSNDTPSFEVDSASGSSGSWSISSSELPPVNTTWTYFVEGQRLSSQGGEPNSWAQTTITGSSNNEITVFRQNYTPPDTDFTASSPTIAWDASSFTVTLTGVQVGDEVRAVLTSNTSVLFENFTTVTSTTFDLVCNNSTVNSTNLPYGTATSVRIQVRRPASADGSNITSGATTFNVTRNYRVGPFTNVLIDEPSGASATIGAQAYDAYDNSPPGNVEPVRVTGSGVISGATYIGRIISGTTRGKATQGIIYSQVASGTEPNAETTDGGCTLSQLPTPGYTVGDQLTVSGSNINGGTDAVVTVDTVNSSGVITAASVTGTASNTDTFSGVTGSVIQGSGTNPPNFTVTLSNNTYSSVVIQTPNTSANFAVNDKIKILGSQFGGVDVTNDLILKVTQVTFGKIQAVVVDSGVAPDVDLLFTNVSYTTGSLDSTATINIRVQGTSYSVVVTSGGAGNTCGYRITCIVPTSLGGDGTTEHECQDNASNQTEFTITRSAYVQPDTTTNQMTITGTGVVSNGFQEWLIANNNTTTNPSLGVTGTETNQKYRINNGYVPNNASEVLYYSFGTGNSSLSATITNSDIVTGTGIDYFLYTQVPEVEDGQDDSVWSLVTTNGSTLVRGFIDREAALVSPTITLSSTAINSADYSKVVPYIRIADTGAAQDAGNLQIAFSTTSSTPSSWVTRDTGGLNKDGYYYSMNASYSRTSQTVYMGVRRISAVTGATTTPSYGNVSITSNTNLLDPGGANLSVYLNNNNNSSFAGYVGDGNNEIRLFTGDTDTEVVLLEGLSNPTADVIDVNDDSPSSSFFFTNTTFQSQYGIDITSGSTAGSPVLTVGDDVGSQLLPIGDISDTINLITSELPAVGNRVDYEVWRRQLVANGGSGTKQYPSNAASESEFFARRFDPVDDTITVTGVRQTLANNHSTDLVLTITDGNASTQYQLYSQGAVYDTRVGNGTLTATNPGELPTAGNTRNYNIQYRQDGTSDTYQNTSGTGTSFTLGRLAAMDLGVLSNPVSIEATTSSGVITLSGAVGNITALLTKNSGGGTVRLSKNGQTFANSTASGTSITVVDGDTLQVLAETPTAYSNTTQSTLTLTQDSVTIFSDTFSFTTESSPTGSAGGGGGTGDYGLEIRDSSGNVIITNSDRVGDFCYATTVSVASGASTGVSTTESIGGNVVIIENDLNPNNANERVYATLENDGKQVRINMLGVTASTNLTFNVLVFNV